MVEEFEKRKSFHLAITPEGTRGLVSKWKMGFYHIALKANVPIQLAYIDYGKKELGIKVVSIRPVTKKPISKKFSHIIKMSRPSFPRILIFIHRKNKAKIIRERKFYYNFL